MNNFISQLISDIKDVHEAVDDVVNLETRSLEEFITKISMIANTVDFSDFEQYNLHYETEIQKL